MKKYVCYVLLFLVSIACACGQTAETYFQQGQKLYEEKDFKNASIVFKKAISEDKTYIKAYRMLWKSHMENKKNLAALYTIRDALAIDSTLAEAYLDRGYIICNIFKMPENALNQLDTAIMLRPDYGDAYFQKGMLVFTMGKRDEACQNWLKAQELQFERASLFIDLYCKKK